MAAGRRGRTRYSYLDSPRPLAFAHRGGAAEAEENTMTAFEHAVDLGYCYLETDIQATRDDVAVVFHDEEVSRMTDGRGRILDLTWAEVRRLRTPGGAAIARLDELLERWPRLHLNLDPKSDAAVEPMARVLEHCCAVGRVCVASFKAERVRRLRRRLGAELCWAPDALGVAWLWLSGFGLPLAAPGYGAVQIPTQHRGIPLATRRLVARAHRLGVQVHVWTVDEPGEMERLLDLGVDGLMTDRPSLLKAVLQRRGAWTGG